MYVDCRGSMNTRTSILLVSDRNAYDRSWFNGFWRGCLDLLRSDRRRARSADILDWQRDTRSLGRAQPSNDKKASSGVCGRSPTRRTCRDRSRRTGRGSPGSCAMADLEISAERDRVRSPEVVTRIVARRDLN